MKISDLKTRIQHTLAKPLLDIELVVNACAVLSEKIKHGDYHSFLEQAGLINSHSSELLSEAATMLSREYLLHKLQTELGHDLNNPKRFPLGVLFHISAGNMDGLPAYSVIEGLLAGNINLLKLPQDEPGISSFLLKELVNIEPCLKEYIYVFRISSKEQFRIKQLIDLADAVVLWGGDEAVTALRTLTPPGIPVIEWGHKISFAYITPECIKNDQLQKLADHIIATNQLLCSSCQGIYLDTDDELVITQFCQNFIDILAQTALRESANDMGTIAQNTLRVYNQKLTSIMNANTMFYEKEGASVQFSSDSFLEASAMFGNCWVKSLPRQQIMSTLRPHRGYLQTVGLLCDDAEWDSLSFLFCRAGAVYIRKPGDMSRLFWGESHDGDYPLRRYSKIIES